MSKSNSNHFSNTRGKRISQGIIPSNQKKRVIDWARKVAAALDMKSKRQRDKFKSACIVFDEKTGNVYFGRNGGIDKTASNTTKNPILFGNSTTKGILPKESLNNYPTPWNCAETDAINKALNSGAKLENLHIFTIDTTKKNFGKDKASCINCTIAYKGRIKKNNSGWSK
ncbi:hypothetical protein [uncultured Eubacterium sp.]|uniref:hypothetical protein n=1 Tax=uncultured Eubacterium sp. TaxID=165185 RepID=UPI0025934D69|nr:hypothetical protein [uncultured Eubacterium sp.]